MFLANGDWILLLILGMSLCVSVGYGVHLYKAVRQFPRVRSAASSERGSLVGNALPRISVLIPAFNETENIEGCVRAVLSSTNLSEDFLEVWVVDDQSTDNTLQILKNLQAVSLDPRLHLLVGAPRPEQQYWTGKSWACHQASQRATGEWLLFIDADVRLKPGAIEAVIQTAIAKQADLLTCVPEIVCGSLIEWLVQPLIFINVLVAFNSGVVKNPKTLTSYALGPFLLFRRSTYEAIGGHASVASEIAEDVAFARKVKRNGYAIKHILGPEIAALRMYRSWSTLWEGWTKVLYVGANSSVGMMLLLVMVMLALYSMPWVGLGIGAVHLLQPNNTAGAVEVGLAACGVLLQYWIRSLGAFAFGSSTRYWWLQGVGGVLVAVMAIASIIKAETGWGWTWRGRSLKHRS